MDLLGIITSHWNTWSTKQRYPYCSDIVVKVCALRLVVLLRKWCNLPKERYSISFLWYAVISIVSVDCGFVLSSPTVAWLFVVSSFSELMYYTFFHSFTFKLTNCSFKVTSFYYNSHKYLFFPFRVYLVLSRNTFARKGASGSKRILCALVFGACFFFILSTHVYVSTQSVCVLKFLFGLEASQRFL